MYVPDLTLIVSLGHFKSIITEHGWAQLNIGPFNRHATVHGGVKIVKLPKKVACNVSALSVYLWIPHIIRNGIAPSFKDDARVGLFRVALLVRVVI